MRSRSSTSPQPRCCGNCCSPQIQCPLIDCLTICRTTAPRLRHPAARPAFIGYIALVPRGSVRGADRQVDVSVPVEICTDANVSCVVFGLAPAAARSSSRTTAAKVVMMPTTRGSKNEPWIGNACQHTSIVAWKRRAPIHSCPCCYRATR